MEAVYGILRYWKMTPGQVLKKKKKERTWKLQYLPMQIGQDLLVIDVYLQDTVPMSAVI